VTDARASLEARAARYGIAAGFHDIWGKPHAASDATLTALLAEFGTATGPDQALPPAAAIAAQAPRWSVPLGIAGDARRLRWRVLEEGGARHDGEAQVAPPEFRLELALPLPPGYHRLGIEGLSGETLLIAAPPRCYRPPALADGGRVWGPAVQLYALRSERNWGIGDFGDLAKLVELAAERGAGIIGLNPLHALFPHNPAHASPYSPSSRLQLNVLYVDVEAVDEFRECETAQRRVRSAEFQARLAQLRVAPRVDYAGVAAAKVEILELL
jgi:(1->4)-alpha-D-glucan 1-alpha-D-glucosylmutase